MKRIILNVVAAVCLLAMAGCGNITVYEPALLEKSSGNPTDDAEFSFDTAGANNASDCGLTIKGDNDGSAYQGDSISSDRAYAGSKSLKVTGVFNTPDLDAILLGKKNASADMRGKNVSVAVWTPYGMFDSKAAYGITFYAIYIDGDGHYNWCQSSWINMSAASAVAGGLWSYASVATSTFTDTTTGLPMTDAAMTSVYEWGVKIGQGGVSPNFTGSIYIDSLDMQ